MPGPATIAAARLISIPSDRRPTVNDLFLRRGRWIEGNRPDEIVASEGFVIANKRSMNPGFAGIDNELYYADNTLMVFGDAKAVLGEIAKALTGVKV